MRSLTLLAVAALASSASAAEKWADPELKTTRGLVLWLDASRQPAAWQAHGKALTPTNPLLDVWYDGSGQGLHLTQRLRDSQPRLIRAGEKAVVRFDGKDDCLGLTGQKRSLERCTLFLHAAPRSNPGGFRGLFAVNETGKNDYLTGFNVDLTGLPSAAFDCLNVEGRGFVGAVNLLHHSSLFGGFHTMAVTCEPGPDGVRLYLDGNAEGKRVRADGTLRMDDITVGARFYSNSPEPPLLSGFLDGDIAEVLLFDRVLSEDERKAVEGYLRTKYEGLSVAIRQPAEGVPLVTVKDPPPVQVLVPGFRVKELPVDLPNVNNVRYRADGKLVALGYNGNVYVLSDTDGDGLEDRVEPFWENKGQIRSPIGMALTPPGYRHGQGVFVACKGKVSLLVDSKGTGKADKEIIVAQGWKELPHNVDALGVALDKGGNVYFGLGCADFTNPYLLDKQGKAHYDLKSERGAILRASPDFKTRETVATGIRFPVGLAFNARGDLFATDQEGATWLANGNPFDELLHIRSGRHYGFPPRHPKHLPAVIDEPSVLDYGPQHQSTCGLIFNEPVNAGPVFGPDDWRGNALVTGYSRGKLYRTQLVRSDWQYVARNHLLACLNMLTVDSCVSPKGELVVAVHSGAPDWGSGPAGKGKLYKIIPEKKAPPRPVLAWPSGPGEVRVAFDQPLDPQALQGLMKSTLIEYGEHVRAGDRFEVLRPGYAVVQQQLAAPRYRLPVFSAAVTTDRRTLVLATAPQRRPVSHALTLPGWGRQSRQEGELTQHLAIDLGYDLCGVEAVWNSRTGEAVSIWLPHPDLDISRTLTAGSPDHNRFWRSLAQPGQLTLRTVLDVRNLLRPDVQPGSTLDVALEPEKPSLLLSSSRSFTYKVGDGPAVRVFPVTPQGGFITSWRGDVSPSGLLPLELVLETGKDAVSLGIQFWTEDAAPPRRFGKEGLPPPWNVSLRRFLLPWVDTSKSTETVTRKVPELEGGDWLRGRQIFFGDEVSCSKCHRIHGEGHTIGPDLSNLVHRDYASVYKDVVDPSAAINPDYLTYTVELQSGKLLSGVPRSTADGRMIIADSAGRETVIKASDVESLVPSPVSTMPEGIDRLLGKEKMRDLMTFLLTEPLKPAPLERTGAPPPRPRAEVDKILKDAKKPDKPGKKLRIILASGPKDHGPGEHDYPLWSRRWYNLLSLADNVSVDTVSGWPTAKQFETADVIVFYSNNPGWTAGKGEQLDAFLKRGGGLVYLHWAVEGHKDPDALAKRIGLAWKGGFSRFRHGQLELNFRDPDHPITRGFNKVKFVDESYWNLTGDVGNVHVLANGVEDGQERPLLWTHQPEKGRVFVSILGHYTWTFDDPLFRILVLRGIAWTAGEPADRLIDLATVGARIAD